MFQNSVSTSEPRISWNPMLTSFVFTVSRNSRYGCFFPIAIRGARRLMVYFLNRFVRQLPSFSSSGLS